MAVVITVSDVKEGFATTVPDSEIEMLIEIVDGADACLDAAAVPESRQKALKIYAVRHMLQMQANGGKGAVRSESAPSGASRSYSGWAGGDGLMSTSFGSLLKQLDATGCVTGILENSSNVMILSVGRC
jgi:hypothetical protein